MAGELTDDHRQFWHQLAKTDVGAKKFHIPSLCFYFIDILILIFNIVNHISNGAYLAFGLTLIIHFFSTYLISFLYKCNEVEIDEDNTAFNNERRKCWFIFRKLSRWLGITPLFRILSNWNDQKVKHETIKSNIKLRRDIDREEVDALVQNKKRRLVRVYFDGIHAYFKTLLQCILQIYLAVDTKLPLIFCNMTDAVRVATMFWSVILASKVVAEYTCVLAEYLKALRFQDFLVHNHNDGISSFRTGQFWVCLSWNFIVVGSRLYAIAYLLTLGGCWAPAQIGFLFCLNLIWIRTSSPTRPIYENPPSGKTTLTSDLVDRFIGIFCFHEIRPLVKNVFIHQFLFAMVFVTIRGVYEFFVENFKYTASAKFQDIHIPVCNFSILSVSNGLTQYFHGVLNSQWGPSPKINLSDPNSASTFQYQPDVGNVGAHFKEIFSNEIVAFSFLFAAGFASIFYAIYLSKEENNSNVPLQVSLKAWQKFLDEDWVRNKTVVKALKLVLLGVLDNNALELNNFKIPEDISQLKEFLISWIKWRGYDYKSQIPPSLPENNPCADSLIELRNFLAKGNCREAKEVAEYFQKYFYHCMEEMTSHRIAQTEAILFGRNLHYFLSYEVRSLNCVQKGLFNSLNCCSKNLDQELEEIELEETMFNH